MCFARLPAKRVRAGMSVRIKRLQTSPEVSHRLREIGFVEETVIRLVTCHANVICQICNARLAVSAQLAQVIWVEPILPV